MKKLSSFLFIFILSFYSFSQLKIIDASRDREFKLDLAQLIESTHSKIIFKAFFLNKGGYGNDKIYKSLSDFNSELFDFTLYNTVNNDSVALDLIKKIQESITKRKPYEEIDKQFYDWDKASGTSSKDLKISRTGFKTKKSKTLTQSTLYFCIKNDAVNKLLEKNKHSLSLQKLKFDDLPTSQPIFYLANINGVSEFFWKLNQLFLFFESNKELLKNKANDESSDSEFDIQFQSSGLYGIAPKINLKNSLYSSNHNVQSMIGFDFKVMAVQSINDLDLGFGLGFSRTYVTTTNSIEDQSYSTTWTHPQLQGDQIKNIYLNDISEQSDLTLNILNLPLTLRLKKPNRPLSCQFNITPSFVLPSNITSRITSGNISYRGQVEGIDDELYDISELGLFDNISLNQSFTQKYSGWGIAIGGSINYAFKIGSMFIGVGYNFQRLKSDFSKERLHISEEPSQYNSSFLSADSFSLSSIMINAGLNINLNSSEK